jgi:kumamolisin
MEKYPHHSSARPHTKETIMTAAADGAINIKINIILRRNPAGSSLPTLEEFTSVPRSERKIYHSTEFLERFGATQSDIDQVIKFASSQGLVSGTINLAARSVFISGTIRQMNAAFGITLNNYQKIDDQGRTINYRGFDGSPVVPSELVSVIELILGLDNRPTPAKHTSQDPPNSVILTPPQVAALYNFPPGDGFDQNIGIFEMFTFFSVPAFTQPDIIATMAGFGFTGPAVVPTVVLIDGFLNTATVSEPETLLDITVASAVAPGANIIVYFTGFSIMNIVDAIQAMVHPGTGEPELNIVSISYAWDNDAETSVFTPADFNQLDSLFFDAALKGITVLIASGDTGCVYQNSATTSVSFPASDPNVLACGGTTIGNITNSGFDEYVWNDSFLSDGQSVPVATGGGVSAYFQLPAYQKGYGIPVQINSGFAGRGIPDVAGNASVNSGYNLSIGGIQTPVGGTSMVAPLYAGLIARINSNLGISAGFINAELYPMATSICRDVNPYATNPPSGPVNNNFNNAVGYPAGPGWDACTGWGSIDGTILQSFLKTLQHSIPVFVPVYDGLATLTVGGEDDGGSYTFVYMFGHLVKVIHNPPVFFTGNNFANEINAGESALLAISVLGNIISRTPEASWKGNFERVQKQLVENFRSEISDTIASR